ncbi:MAG: hypothetical protein N3E37_00890 [Candidatus Micrarchaeota archaeon]|nr:hypothetical protein [Candidatus Micrarchaeota archaeon]
MKIMINSNLSSSKSNKVHLVLELFLLLFLTNNAYAQYQGFTCDLMIDTLLFNQRIGLSPLSNYAILSFLIIFTGFIILTVLYMLQHFFVKNAEFEIFIKAEFLQLVASFVILLTIVFLVETSINIITPYINAFNPHLRPIVGPVQKYSLACFAAANIDYALYKLNIYYNQLIREVFQGERELSRCFSIFGFQFCPGLMDYLTGSSRYYNIFQRVIRAHMLGDMAINLQISLAAQMQLLRLINYTSLSILLPYGIALRILPITRGIGGLMLATAIGFYFVFPLAYFVALEIPAGELVERTTIPGQVCYPSFAGVISTYESWMSSFLTTFSIIDVMTDFIAQLRIFEWIIPFVALAVTAIFIRFTAPLLGSDSVELFSVINKLT